MIDMLQQSTLEYDLLPAYHIKYVTTRYGHVKWEKSWWMDQIALHNCALTGKLMCIQTKLCCSIC